MKLRHRRVANGDVGPILPLTMNFDSNISVNRNRRRRKSTQSETRIKDAVFYLIVCLSSLILIVYIVLPMFPDQPNRSHPHKFVPKRKINKKEESKHSITCADGTTMGLLDDNYCDCDDGRDEPNTSACSNVLVQKHTFRCKDGNMIYTSRVKDGVYDCPDQTDEISL